jgi:hypothetical protein
MAARERHNQASITERKKEAISQIPIIGIGNTPTWKAITHTGYHACQHFKN